MITILPAAGPEKDKYLEQTGWEGTDCELLLMKDREQVLGGAAVTIENSELFFWLFVERASLSSLTAEQRFIADSLLRAAASFGANQGAYRLAAQQQEGWDFFRAEGFSMDDSGRMLLSTSAIVKICKET